MTVRTWDNSPNIRHGVLVHASAPRGIFRGVACQRTQIVWDALRNATNDPITCLECLAL